MSERMPKSPFPLDLTRMHVVNKTILRNRFVSQQRVLYSELYDLIERCSNEFDIASNYVLQLSHQIKKVRERGADVDLPEQKIALLRSKLAEKKQQLVQLISLAHSFHQDQKPP